MKSNLIFNDKQFSCSSRAAKKSSLHSTIWTLDNIWTRTRHFYLKKTWTSSIDAQVSLNQKDNWWKINKTGLAWMQWILRECVHFVSRIILELRESFRKSFFCFTWIYGWVTFNCELFFYWCLPEKKYWETMLFVFTKIIWHIAALLNLQIGTAVQNGSKDLFFPDAKQG